MKFNVKEIGMDTIEYFSFMRKEIKRLAGVPEHAEIGSVQVYCRQCGRWHVFDIKEDEVFQVPLPFCGKP